jgi:hypothetical protein
MSSTQDLRRYEVASRFLQEGRRDWVLVLVGELLQSQSGRPFALQLLAEMYRKTSGTEVPDGELAMPASGSVEVLAAFDRGV